MILSQKENVKPEPKLNNDSTADVSTSSPAIGNTNVSSRFSLWKLKLCFRFFAIMDVLFASRFELTTFRKDGTQLTKTRFNKTEIENLNKH
jgi:hypothetical protein